MRFHFGFFTNPAVLVDNPWTLPDAEVWYEAKESVHGDPGFYFWFCLPGCLPDSEAYGPYASVQEATEAARAMVED